MTKLNILNGLFALVFLAACFMLWRETTIFIQKPYAWLRFDTAIFTSSLMVNLWILLTIVSLAMMTILSLNIMLSIVIFVFGALLSVIFIPVSFYTIILIGAFVVACVMFKTSCEKALSNNIKFNVYQAMQGNAASFLLILILIITLGHYQAGVYNLGRVNNPTLPDSILDRAVRFNGAENLPTDAHTPPSELKDKLNSLGINLLDIGQFNIKFNIIKNSQEAIQKAMKDQIQFQVDKLFQQYKNFLPVLSAIIVYFSLDFFKFIILAVFSPIVSVIFFVLKSTNLIEIEKIQVEAERLKTD